jgi:hypothetical protein
VAFSEYVNFNKSPISKLLLTSLLLKIFPPSFQGENKNFRKRKKRKKKKRKMRGKRGPLPP